MWVQHTQQAKPMRFPDPPTATTLASKRIPEAFLRAEIAAFPLASEESFRSALLKLDPRLGEDNRTRNHWRACESLLAQHTGWSLDRLVSARDRGWFGLQGNQPVTLHRYLRTLACSHLVERAGVTEIEESTDLTSLDAMAHYRWLTISLPEDLLLSALGVDPPPTSVDIDPPLLVRHLLDSGVAEIHQHIGAGMSFPFLWASALAAIASPDIREDELASPGAPLSDGKFLVRWLLAAAVARCALAEHLIRGEGNFRVFLRREFLGGAAEPRQQPAWIIRRREMLVAILDALATGEDKRLPEIEPLRDFYADIHPTALTLRDHPIAKVMDAFQRCDPIAVRMNLSGVNVGERWLLRHSLDYLARDERQGDKDEYFARIFWQTVRIRCQYYRTVVQRPLTGGLQWFIRFYGRLGKLRDPLTPILPEISYHVAGETHRIKALELRTSVDDTAIGIGECVYGFLQSWQRVLKDTSGSGFEPEMGLIFHFVKSRDTNKAWSEGVPAAFWAETHAETRKASSKARNSSTCRFAWKKWRP
jgi:hypothetical protein